MIWLSISRFGAGIGASRYALGALERARESGRAADSACREEVWGDLHERYKSPGRYLVDLVAAMPFMVVSRIRRTTGLQLFVMQGLVLYASFVTVAGYLDKALLRDDADLAGLAIPVGITLVLLTVQAVWEPLAGSLRARFSAFFWLVFGNWLLASVVPWLPWRVSSYGFYAGVMLASAARLLLQPARHRSQAARGLISALNLLLCPGSPRSCRSGHVHGGDYFQARGYCRGCHRGDRDHVLGFQLSRKE